MEGPGVGFKFPARKVSWLKRDVLLYNLSIGCRADEPQFVYEGHPKFSAFPTLPLGLVFKLNSQEVTDFYAMRSAVEIPGVPTLDPTRLVDGDRTIQLLKPLPLTSQGRDFEFCSKVLGVYDKGKTGTVVRSEDKLVDAATGEAYAKTTGSEIYVGQGGWGGPRGPAVERVTYPERSADVAFVVDVDHQAAHLYRLNGDYNPLHATPEYGEKMGYGGMIMHGVFAYSRIAHDFVRKLGGGEPNSMREFSARFAGPVKPGDRVHVEVWEVADLGQGLGDFRWRAQVEGATKMCLTDGRAQVRKAKVASRI